MQPPTQHGDDFFDHCKQIYDRACGDLPEVCGKLTHSNRPVTHDWAPEEWWFPIYGRNAGHPKFWDDVVSNYFLIKKKSGQEWRVGMHFSPDQKKRCSGHIYGADMERLLGACGGKEGFIYIKRPTSTDTTKLWIKQTIRLSDAEAAPLLVTKLHLAAHPRPAEPSPQVSSLLTMSEL